jgi:malonate transporter
MLLQLLSIIVLIFFVLLLGFLLALALVLIGVSVHPMVDSALGFIGRATSGIALFVSGLNVAANELTVSLEVGVNTVLKMVAQPVLYAPVSLALSVAQPYGHEGLLLTLLPTGPIVVLFATRYKMYQSEAASTPADPIRPLFRRG